MNDNECINIISDSFYGGVIYIDLRGYTKIVDEKPLTNIAEIIYSYQNKVKLIIENNFNLNEISSIEFVGDGVMSIIRKNSLDNYSFGNRLFEVSCKLKDEIYKLIENKKNQYYGLNDLDFGIGISTSDILKKNISENNLSLRDIYFGNSLNRACKIGDKMNSKKNYIGIDKRMYDENNNNMYNNSLENDNYYILYNNILIKEKEPIVHLILRDFQGR